MKTVILVRHAKSSWAELGVSDFDRPLNNRGKRDAPEMARRLKKRNIPIDFFISSPAKRAKMTAQFFAEAYDYKKNNILFVQELYMADTVNFNSVISNSPSSANSIIIFSHNPGITSFVNTLTGVKVDNMPTCGIFSVSATCNSWEDFDQASKEFLFFDYPKALQE